MQAKSNTGVKIPFNFTYYAMKLLGKNLYSNPWTAISEIVANGIDSKADTVHVLVDMRDKEHAKVEIFDNGYGMSYEDLRDKYTLIGRNKRESGENIAGKTLGRKGIGKLAALFLSPTYYLYTKTEQNQTAWVVDTANFKDNDIPTMDEVTASNDRLIASELWGMQKTGTMIHLSEVDLRKIGPERLKRLPLYLADYYLDTVIDCRILVCVLQNEADTLEFREIEKKINFDTMYAIFDNTEYGYKEKIQPALYLTKDDVYPEVDFPRETQLLDRGKYDCDGTIELTDLQGKTRVVPYTMRGWIGIHCSLDKAILERNSPDAKKLRPHALRLYVRGKLAVSNLINYISLPQALASYVEGEISFDILDEDMFEDSSTSNREGYSVTDPRVQRLIEITRKIVRALINERTAIGNTINSEIKEIRERLLAEEQKQKEEAERKAEEERKKSEEEERRRKEAEDQARREAAARKAAEEERDQAQAENASQKQRLFVLENNFSASGERYKHGVHLAVNFAKEIRGSVLRIKREAGESNHQLVRTVMEIDRSAEKIVRLPSYIDAVNFPMTSPEIELDVVEFIKQYIESRGNSKLVYSFNMPVNVEREIDFSDIIMLIENIISNSVKAKAKHLSVVTRKSGTKVQIDFIDDGLGLHEKYRNKPDEIFKLGATTTIGGFGIGCFHMKEIVDSLGGEIHAIQNIERGLTIRVTL